MDEAMGEAGVMEMVTAVAGEGALVEEVVATVVEKVAVVAGKSCDSLPKMPDHT